MNTKQGQPKSARSFNGELPGYDVRGITADLRRLQKGGKKWQSFSLFKKRNNSQKNG
jgi:hypothetical protein